MGSELSDAQLLRMACAEREANATGYAQAALDARQRIRELEADKAELVEALRPFGASMQELERRLSQQHLRDAETLCLSIAREHWERARRLVERHGGSDA